MSEQSGAAGARLTSIDIARFLAISLVFYGHLVEQVMYLENAAAAAQYKWVYSFHMPLFFLLAGVVVSERGLRVGTFAYLGKRWRSRVVPYLFFSAVLAVLATFIPGWFPTVDLSSMSGFGEGVVSTLLGMPAFNVPLWFLSCLVGIEILHFFTARVLTTRWRLAVAAVASYMIGVYLNRWINFFGEGWNVWLVHLVPLGYAFYLSGVLLRRSGLLERAWPRWQLAAGALVCLAGVFLTYDLNQGPFRVFDAVVILLGAPGHVLLFPLTAFLGIAMVLMVARLLPQWGWLQYLGEITLLIYGLHGLFYHFVNPPLAGWIAANLPAAGWSVFLATAVSTVVSVALVVPLAMLIERFLPQVVGRQAAPRQGAVAEAGI